MPRGRDGLYRRGKSYAFRYKDTDDKWREKCCGSSDRQTARDFRSDFLADLKEGMLPTKMAEWRVDQAEEWWNGFRRPLIAEGTNRSEPYIVRHLRRIIGNKRLKEITNQDLDRYVSTRLAGYEYQADDETVKMGPAGAWSINKEVRLWRQILRKAKLWQRLSHDYRPLKTKVSDVGEALTREELRRVADTAQSDVAWEAAFYGSVLAANTGLRGGEIKKLRIGSVDLENRRLRILRGDAKSDASARMIELNRDACEAAARLIFRASKLKPSATQPDHYLLPKQLSRIQHGKGKGQRGYDPHQHMESWGSAWASLTKKAGFPALRFHSLRHTFITHMVELGAPIGVIQTFVGHMSARMVRHYTHISTGAVRKAVEMLDANPVFCSQCRRRRVLTAERKGGNPMNIYIVAAAPLAIAAHECGHYVTARCLGVKTYGFRINWRGVGLARDYRDCHRKPCNHPGRTPHQSRLDRIRAADAVARDFRHLVRLR